MFSALFQYMILTRFHQISTKYLVHFFVSSLQPSFLLLRIHIFEKKKKLQNVRYAAFLLIIKEHTRLQLNKNLSTSSAFNNHFSYYTVFAFIALSLLDLITWQILNIYDLLINENNTWIRVFNFNFLVNVNSVQIARYLFINFCP